MYDWVLLKSPKFELNPPIVLHQILRDVNTICIKQIIYYLIFILCV